MSQPPWVSKPFTEMSQAEWESLCDGCAKCCLHKLEDHDTGEIFYTNVACELLDDHKCQCRDYDNRLSLVADCLKLTPENLPQQQWLPSTCAYRLLLNGAPLPYWHPLVSGDSQSVHNEGMSVRGRVLPEESVHEDDLEDHIIHWVE